MKTTAYDIALRRIERIPIYCDADAGCTAEMAAGEIQRVLRQLNHLNYMYPPSLSYVYVLDAEYKESGLVIAKMVREHTSQAKLAAGEFAVHS